MKAAIVLFLVLFAANAHCSVLVLSSDGTYVPKATLAAAAVAPDAAGKSIIVTSPQTLTASLSWPADRDLVFKGGYIVPNGYFLTGLKTARPEDFGAKPDGITPSGAAITKAVASVNKGGAVVFSAGVYSCDDASIQVNQSVEIYGQGAHTVLKKTNGDVMVIAGISYNTDGTHKNEIGFPHVHDISFDGGSKNNGHAGIYEHFVYQGRYKNLYFHNLDKGVHIDIAYQSVYENFRNWSPDSSVTSVNYFLFTDRSANDTKGVTGDLVIKNFQARAYNTVIYLKGVQTPDDSKIVDGVNINGCLFYNGKEQVHLEAVHYGTISDNKFYQPWSHMLRIIESIGLNIYGNEMVWNTYNSRYTNADYADAIYITGVKGAYGRNAMLYSGSTFLIHGNQIKEVSGHGIHLENVFNAKIFDNDIYNPNYDGFFRHGMGQPYLGRLFTHNGIRLEHCSSGEIRGNRIGAQWQTTGAASDRIPRTHSYDIYLDETTTGFTVQHAFESEVNDLGANAVHADDLTAWSLPIDGPFVNTLAYPEQINGWGASGSNGAPTVTADTVSDPQGKRTADTVACLGNDSYIIAGSSPASHPSAGDVYTGSIYLRADTEMVVDLVMTLNTGAQQYLKQVHIAPTWHRYYITSSYETSSNDNVSFAVGNWSAGASAAAKTFYAWGGEIVKQSSPGPYIMKRVNLAAMPTTGSWKAGDFIYNSAPSAVSRVLGWLRVTTGNGNVLNTDWVAK